MNLDDNILRMHTIDIISHKNLRNMRACNKGLNCKKRFFWIFLESINIGTNQGGQLRNRDFFPNFNNSQFNDNGFFSYCT